MEEVLAVLGGLVEGIQEVTGAIQQLLNVLTPFVAAISPSTVQLLNQAIRDLEATIGSALIPLFQIFASVIREISGIILPLIQQLKPIITDLANTFVNLLASLVRLIVSAITPLVPVIQLVAAATEVWWKILQVIIDVTTVLIRVITDVIASFLGISQAEWKDALKQAVNFLVDAFKILVKYVLLAVAQIAKWIGFADTVSKFAKGFSDLAEEQEKRAAGLKAAPQNPAFENVESIAKKIALAAAIAQGGGAGREKTDTEWLKDIAKDMSDIASGKTNLIDLIFERLGQFWDSKVVPFLKSTTVGKAVTWTDRHVIKPFRDVAEELGL